VIPTGPITITSMAVILTISIVFLIFGDRSQKKIAIAFVISWLGSRYATAFSEPLIIIIAYPLSALLCLSSGDKIVRLIGALYGVRLILFPVTFLIATSSESFWFWLWEVNRIIFYLQIILALGTIGYGRYVRLGALVAASLSRWYNYNIYLDRIWRRSRPSEEGYNKEDPGNNKDDL